MRDFTILNALYMILLKRRVGMSKCASYDIIKMTDCVSECALYDVIEMRACM